MTARQLKNKINKQIPISFSTENKLTAWWHPANKRIYLNPLIYLTLDNYERLLILAHEYGHAMDEQYNGINMRRYQKSKQYRLLVELRAWCLALQFLKQWGIPVNVSKIQAELNYQWNKLDAKPPKVWNLINNKTYIPKIRNKKEVL